jgi:Ferredoxin-like domain in Api92-like protein
LRNRIPTGVEIWLETAWRPPLPVLIELSKKFPELEFQLYFVIEGIGEGLARFKNGETLCYDYVEVDSRSVDWLLSHETPLYKVYRSLFADPARREWVLMRWGICPINSDERKEGFEAASEASLAAEA